MVVLMNRIALLSIFIDSLLSHLGIGIVLFPDSLVEVHMGNHETRTRQRGIPALQLAVLYHIVFVTMATIIEDIGITTVACRLQILHLHILSEFEWFQPSRHILLVSRIACRPERITIIRTTAHEVPVAHAEPTAIAGVVEVGESHAM